MGLWATQALSWSSKINFLWLYIPPPAPIKNHPLEAGILVRADGCDSTHSWPASSFHSAAGKRAWLIHPLQRPAPGALWHLLSPSSPLKLMSHSSDKFLSCLNHLHLWYMAPAFDTRLSSLLSNSHIPTINNVTDKQAEQRSPQCQCWGSWTDAAPWPPAALA